MKIKRFLMIFALSFSIWLLLAIPEELAMISFQEFIVGAMGSAIISGFCTYLTEEGNENKRFKFDRVVAFIVYIPVFILELIKANISMAKICFSKKVNIEPVIVKIHTTLKEDTSLTLLANSITLTPGTISVEVIEEDGENYIYIHWIDTGGAKEEEFGDIIKGKFEPYIRRISEK
ncbi:MAG: Na+/H+ antiporter subunit E [Clostridium sp.]